MAANVSYILQTRDVKRKDVKHVRTKFLSQIQNANIRQDTFNIKKIISIDHDK